MIIKWTNRQQHSSSQGLLLIIGKVHGHVQISHFLSVLGFTSTSLWSVCWYLVHHFGQWVALLLYLWITECATYGWQKKTMCHQNQPSGYINRATVNKKRKEILKILISGCKVQPSFWVVPSFTGTVKASQPSLSWRHHTKQSSWSLR